jgi:hypothetical protein
MLSLTLCRASVLAALSLSPLLAGAQALAAERIGAGTVTSLSADGSAAAGSAHRTYEPFRWTAATGLVKLGRGTQLPLGHRSGTPRVSVDGQVVSATILSDDGTMSTAGRWTSTGGWKMLGPLPADTGPLDGEDASAFGLSGDGNVVTGLYWRLGYPGGSAHGMRWTAAGGVEDMGSSGGSSRIDDASADGSVMVGWDEHPDFGNRRATVWVNGQRTVLDESDWPSEASVVNSDGTIVVGHGADPANGFQTSAMMWRWQAGSWVKSVLGVIARRGNGAAIPTGLSDDGSIVVGTARPDASQPTSTGFVWTAATGMVDAKDWLAERGVRFGALNALYTLSAISADGQVIAALTLNRRTGAASSHLVRRAP